MKNELKKEASLKGLSIEFDGKMIDIYLDDICIKSTTNTQKALFFVKKFNKDFFLKNKIEDFRPIDIEFLNDNLELEIELFK